jgi:hypothetical protein
MSLLAIAPISGPCGQISEASNTSAKAHLQAGIPVTKTDLSDGPAFLAHVGDWASMEDLTRAAISLVKTLDDTTTTPTKASLYIQMAAFTKEGAFVSDKVPTTGPACSAGYDTERGLYLTLTQEAEQGPWWYCGGYTCEGYMGGRRGLGWCKL